MDKKLFAVIAGPRLGGKTTIAGTLPGKTLLLQAAILESGSRSAEALARKRGNQLKVDMFMDIVDLRAKLEKEAKSKDYDHIFIDGFSAINDMRWGSNDMQDMYKRDQWGAFGKHGQDMKSLLQWMKGYTYEPFGKNVFLTCALKGEGADVELECKGKVAVTEITKLGEAVLTVMQVPAEEGQKRVMITRSYNNWPGRIDGILDEDNPGWLAPDLSLVLNLLQGAAA
jgi:hypothetical protein